VDGYVLGTCKGLAIAAPWLGERKLVALEKQSPRNDEKKSSCEQGEMT
jgi:hypothetical protein